MVVFDELSNPENQVRIYNKGASLNGTGNGNNGQHVQYRYGEITAPFIRYEEPLRNECAHFLQCIADGSEPRSSGREALHVISILEAAHESLDQGGKQIELDNRALALVGGDD